MTINYSSGNDIIIPTNNTTYRGLKGDDIYVISKAIPSDTSLTIVDTEGKNTIQLADGLEISSTKFSSSAFQITLSNGAIINISAADKNSYEIGGNITGGIRVEQKNYLEFSKLFGIQAFPKSGALSGDANIVIKETSLGSNNIDFSWIEKTPDSIGLDDIEVNELMDFVKVPGFNTQAAILIQGNNIIAEYYGEGYDKSSLVTSWSVAKSFTST